MKPLPPPAPDPDQTPPAPVNPGARPQAALFAVSEGPPRPDCPAPPAQPHASTREITAGTVHRFPIIPGDETPGAPHPALPPPASLPVHPPQPSARPGQATVRPKDDRKAVGSQGEQLVAETLQARGFAILARNRRSRGGELDLVAQKGLELWFVEVKTRRSRRFGTGDVTLRQQRRLSGMAYRFLQEFTGSWESAQFVVAQVCLTDGQPVVTFLEQAFDSPF